MGKNKLKIALIAPPWLSLYPGCYYGIENVVHHLATNLTEQGHHVELFTVSGTRTKVTKKHWFHEEDQYQHIHRPWYEVVSIIVSHILYSINIIREAGDFDIIHDNNSFMGPAIMAYANSGLPPILHTLHEPFSDARVLKSGIPDNRLMFEQFKYIKHLYFSGVSRSQISSAPPELKRRIKGVVYNGVNLDEYTYSDKKDDYYLIVARISANKGQGTAAKAAHELGVKLKMAGTVGAQISTPEKLNEELANTSSQYLNDPDFRYYKEEVAPYIIKDQIEYLGTVSGDNKLNLFAKAKAFVFPIDWEEPFGMAVIDALASGTPVIGYRRGALPEIIEHGVNGFIANNFRELKYYMGKVGEINPEDCRRSVEKRFSTEILSKNYVDLYQEIIRDHKKYKEISMLNMNINPRLLTLTARENLQRLLPGTPISQRRKII
jgi:glycosyltransferase involved in cell wall biosynthesis